MKTHEGKFSKMTRLHLILALHPRRDMHVRDTNKVVAILAALVAVAILCFVVVGL